MSAFEWCTTSGMSFDLGDLDWPALQPSGVERNAPMTDPSPPTGTAYSEHTVDGCLGRFGHFRHLLGNLQG